MVKKRNHMTLLRHDQQVRDFYPKFPKARYLYSLHDPVVENVPATTRRRLVA